MSQKALGKILGVSHQFVSKLEGGESNLPVEKLPLLAMHGFDVQYIVTGVRSVNLNAVKEGVSEPAPGSYDARVRRLTVHQRNVIEGMLEELEKMQAAQEQADAALKLGRELARRMNGNGGGHGDE
jgi:transcriptional regulator with XRE-family HTH domain